MWLASTRYMDYCVSLSNGDMILNSTHVINNTVDIYYNGCYFNINSEILLDKIVNLPIVHNYKSMIAEVIGKYEDFYVILYHKHYSSICPYSLICLHKSEFDILDMDIYDYLYTDSTTSRYIIDDNLRSFYINPRNPFIKPMCINPKYKNDEKIKIMFIEYKEFGWCNVLGICENYLVYDYTNFYYSCDTNFEKIIYDYTDINLNIIDNI